MDRLNRSPDDERLYRAASPLTHVSSTAPPVLLFASRTAIKDHTGVIASRALLEASSASCPSPASQPVTVIFCHGLVDTAAVTALYFDRRSWLIG